MNWEQNEFFKYRKMHLEMEVKTMERRLASAIRRNKT